MIRSRAFAGWGLALTVLLAAATARAGDPQDGANPSVSGYVKDFLLALWPAAAADEPAPGPQGANLAAARVKASWRPAAMVEVQAAYEIGAVFGGLGAALAQTQPDQTTSTYRIADLSSLYASAGETDHRFRVTQNLDRAYVSAALGIGDLILGRQPVAFGSARIVNPTDVLAPFTFQTLDKEERSGVDALRVRFPWESMGELDAGWVLGKDGRWGQSAVFVKPKVYLWGTDVTALALKFRDSGLAGLDLARSVGGAGVWLEAAYVWAGAFGEDRRPGQDYFRLSAGADYSLADGVYAFCEYHFNGAGTERPAETPTLAGRTAYTQGGVHLVGRHYLAPGLTCEVSPLLSLSGQVLWALGDGSAFLGPAGTYSLSDDLVLVGGAFAGLGRAPAADGAVRSEFGAYPSLAYLSLKFYF